MRTVSVDIADNDAVPMPKDALFNAASAFQSDLPEIENMPEAAELLLRLIKAIQAFVLSYERLKPSMPPTPPEVLT